METLTSLAIKAQKGDHEAMVYLYQQFQPLLLKESTRDGKLDLDCYQELSERFIRLIMDFEVQ
ncbi:helix-turn-helix domain-containing protein [Enterococcus faecalis]|nr:helix-turn-helix domain-containing protein [Enterococcus faecalis]